MSRSEVTRVKAFISSQTDRFRATFDRRPKDYPRQCVFVGTTNEDHYLTDPTGNRRFWPVRVTRHIDLQWMRDNREQLLAEAVKCLDDGEVFYPSPDEQRSLFEPQQQQRAVENAIESAIGRYLHDEQQRVPMGGDNGTLLNEVTLVELLNKVGIGIEKLGPGRFHEKQAAGALRKLGWVEARSSKPGRPRVYRRPAQPMSNDSSTRHDAGASTSEPDESIPF
jgi:predicted P-loop ATPase